MTSRGISQFWTQTGHFLGGCHSGYVLLPWVYGEMMEKGRILRSLLDLLPRVIPQMVDVSLRKSGSVSKPKVPL